MMTDENWMHRAVDLAKKGVSGASPNPLVGCVIVKNGRIAGEGYHSTFGGPHAEINALKQAGKRARNATLYVNLEPCCHWGKTPPCTEAIIQYGIRKVVSAMSDPNPIVNNRGLRKLKEAGIEIKTGVLREDARELNRSFIKFIEKRKPYVILKTAMSLDGKIATSTGDSKWITSKTARDFSHRLRTEVDAIMVGAETVRKDNPSLTSHGKGRNPVRIVLSHSGSLPLNSKIFSHSSPTWIFSDNFSSTQHSVKRGDAEWIYIKPSRNKIDFQNLLKHLGERGISRLLVEGGSQISTSALESGEVDELFFIIAPILIGGKAKTVYQGKGIKRIHESIRLEGMTIRSFDNDICINARVINPRARKS